MVHPLVASLVLFGLLLIPVWLASSANPKPPRRPHGPDFGAMAEIEERDIEQMIDGLNERRRRNGRKPIADELADEILRPSPGRRWGPTPR